MSEHTPIPYRWENAALLGPQDNGVSFDDCILRCLGNCGPEPEDADFIVRACNSHDDLLAALKAIMPHIEQAYSLDLSEVVVIAGANATGKPLADTMWYAGRLGRAAIAKAELPA